MVKAKYYAQLNGIPPFECYPVDGVYPELYAAGINAIGDADPAFVAWQRNAAVAEIKLIRSTTEDRFPKNSPGVLAVYDVNYEASVRFQAGDITPLRTGETPAAYLTLLGAEMVPPMTNAEFAAYIIAENVRVGPTATNVEQMYLRYLGQVYTRPIAEVNGIVEAYRVFCAPVSGQ